MDDGLSLLWNASDDVFFPAARDWARATERFCRPELVRVLLLCLRSGQPSHQQASAIMCVYNYMYI